MTMARVFLCHADEDEEKAAEIYCELETRGFRPWMPKKDILGGEIRVIAIQKAVQECDFFLLLLSPRSTTARGNFRKAIQTALSKAGEMLDTDIYMIPVMPEPMDKQGIPEKMQGLQWVALYEPEGWERLMRAFQEGMKRRAKTDPTTVFLVAPQLPDDLATEYTISWARQVHDAIRDLENVRLSSVLGSEAVRCRVEELLEKDRGNPGIFIFIDHGERDRLLGADEEAVIDMDNLDLLKNKFVYAIACRSAAGLAALAYEKGAIGYLGFNNDFHIIPSSQAIFGRCFLAGLMAILKENSSPFQARLRIELRMNDVIGHFQKLPTEVKTHRQQMVIAALRHNLDSISYWGDPNWRIGGVIG